LKIDKKAGDGDKIHCLWLDVWGKMAIFTALKAKKINLLRKCVE
jgi:hypothetical protein